MGMRQVHMMVDNDALNRLLAASKDERFDILSDMEEDSAAYPSYSVDKLWDGLHFIFTGKSAVEPIDGNPLSEAIVGVKSFDEKEDNDCEEDSEDDAILLSYIPHAGLGDLVNAMQNLNWTKIEEKLNLEQMRDEEIYPDIWYEEEKNELLEELHDEAENLLKFFIEAQTAGRNIVVSIW